MIFFGDLACPVERNEFFQKWTAEEELFRDQIIILNFEANIVNNAEDRKKLTLYNVSRITECFPHAKKVIVSLANNHMYDYPEKILDTKSYLESKGIGCFGLYDNGRIVPYEFEENGVRYALFGHCWRLYTHTNCNNVNDIRVVDCLYDEFIEKVRNYVETHHETRVYCFMHWNYDLERLPLPMHRKLSRELIDLGVSGVIGGHSHRPQGMELYKGKPIVYCMGNFYLPSGIYFDGRLKYPDCSMTTYGVKITDHGMRTLWFKTDLSDTVPLTLVAEEYFGEGENCKKHSPFAEMDDNEYLTYFSNNRAKTALVAKFPEPYGKRYLLDEAWAINRVRILRRLKGLLKK